MNNNNFEGLKHFIDPELEKNKDKLYLRGEKFDLDGFREMFPSTEKKYKMLIYWDDMMQYTAIGLADVLYEEMGFPFYFDFVDFVNRENDYVFGIDYVIKNLFKDMQPSYIRKVFKERYVDILERSPKTELFDKIYNLQTMTDNITFVFRHKFEGMHDLIESFKIDGYIPIKNINSVVLPNEDVERKYLIDARPDIIVTQDMGFYYHAILDIGLYDKTIISTLLHNGVNRYILAIYGEKFMGTPSGGPCRCDLIFLEEEGYRNEDRSNKDE